MNDLINFITGGSTEFTPQVMVGLIVFVLITDGIFTLTSSIIKGVHR